MQLGVIYVRYRTKWYRTDYSDWQPYGEIAEFSNGKAAYTRYADGLGGIASAESYIESYSRQNPHEDRQFKIEWRCGVAVS